MEPVDPVQMNIYQSNTYRKDFSCLHFNDEPRLQERQQEGPTVLHICCLAYLTIPSSKYGYQPRHDNSIPSMAVRSPHGERKFTEQIKTTIFLEAVLAIEIFPVLKSTSHFMLQSTVSPRSDSSSEANSSCCHRSDA